MNRLVVLNAFSPSMLQSPIARITFVRITLSQAQRIVQVAQESNLQIVSYVGHEATAQLLSQLLHITIPFNRSMYQHNPSDIMLIFSLNRRLQSPADLQSVTENDLLITLAFSESPEVQQFLSLAGIQLPQQ